MLHTYFPFPIHVPTATTIYYNLGSLFSGCNSHHITGLEYYTRLLYVINVFSFLNNVFLFSNHVFIP